MVRPNGRGTRAATNTCPSRPSRQETSANMRPNIPTPTELREKLTPLLTAAYRAKRALTKDEIALIKDATGNPDIILTIHRESELPNGKWCYTRRRDAEKIVALTIWIRTQETAIKATEVVSVTTATEVVKPPKTGKPKPQPAIEPVTPAVASEDTTPVITVETKTLAKAPRVKTTKLKAAPSNEPVESVTITATPDLEAEALPVTQTPVNSPPTRKQKRETPSKNTSATPTPTPSAQGQLLLW